MTTTEWLLLGASLFACWRWARARLECQGIYSRAAEELKRLRQETVTLAEDERVTEEKLRLVQTLSRVLDLLGDGR